MWCWLRDSVTWIQKLANALYNKITTSLHLLQYFRPRQDKHLLSVVSCSPQMCSMCFVAILLHNRVIFLNSSCESNERMRLTRVSLDSALIGFHCCSHQWDGHEQYILHLAGKTCTQPLELHIDHCCSSAKGSGWWGSASLTHWETETNLEQRMQKESFKN